IDTVTLAAVAAVILVALVIMIVIVVTAFASVIIIGIFINVSLGVVAISLSHYLTPFLGDASPRAIRDDLLREFLPTYRYVHPACQTWLASLQVGFARLQ